MKKKAIEQIPYITVPRVKSKSGQDIRYVIVTACKTVGGEEHIFLEAYKNQKNSLKVPVARYVATRKDFAVYFPEKDEWTRQQIDNKNSGRLCWNTVGDSRNYEGRRKENMLYSEKELDRIKGFFKDIKVYFKDDWWEYFEENESSIRHDAAIRRYKHRQEALKDRDANTPPLPEQELLKWAEQALFHDKHFLYYKKHGRWATVCCSKCGRVNEGAWKTGQSYENQFEKHLEEPRKGRTGICSLCGAHGTYKPQGKAGSFIQQSGYAFTADSYKEKGAVIRYIEFKKEWVLKQTAGDSGNLELTGAYEKLSSVEVSRTYFEKDKKPKTDYHKKSLYTDFWDDRNLSGMPNISIKPGLLYPASVPNLKGTILQYSAIDLYAAAAGEVNVKNYMERYQHFPQIEMLVKLKLYGIVDELVRYRCGIIRNEHADRPDIFLGIRREKLPLLIRRNGSASITKVLQLEKHIGQNWTDGQCEALELIGTDHGGIGFALQYMTIQKLLNRIEKYAGCSFNAGSGCGTAAGRLQHAAVEYLDYLSMRQQLGYDLNNTVYQSPRDLNAAHAAMVTELDVKEQDKRMQEVMKKFPLIRRNYKKLRKKYFYEDDNYIIRPARSAEEIVREGRMLHHCVGGDTYLSRHNDQRSVILMLRFKESPDVPYITVEINDASILQWYGAHDNKPDKENMQKWLDRYVTMLKCGRLGAGTEEEQVKIKEPVMTA